MRAGMFVNSIQFYSIPFCSVFTILFYIRLFSCGQTWFVSSIQFQSICFVFAFLSYSILCSTLLLRADYSILFYTILLYSIVEDFTKDPLESLLKRQSIIFCLIVFFSSIYFYSRDSQTFFFYFLGKFYLFFIYLILYIYFIYFIY